MAVKTKSEAHYRYPEECCGYCRAAYQSEYGDYQCNWLEPGNIIDLGGVCDLFVRDGPTGDRGGAGEGNDEGADSNSAPGMEGAGSEDSDKDVFGALA